MLIANTLPAARRPRRFRGVIPAILTALLLAALVAGCGGESQSNDSDGEAGSGVSSSSASTDQAVGNGSNAGDGGGSGNSGDGGSASPDQVVSVTNPGATEVPLAGGQSGAPDDAASLDAVQWSAEPMIQAGALEASGIVTQDARLYDPMDDEPSAFSVYYGDNTEVMVELLPDPGPMRVWDTDATVAPSDFELEGDRFTIRAYSPLFMDVGPSDLTLRVWGYDGAGNPALLSVAAVGGQ